MNHLFRFFFISFFLLGLLSCATMEPAGRQNVSQEPINTIMIAVNLSDTPVVNLLGITIFENKLTNIIDFEFSLSRYALTQADSALRIRGFSTLVGDEPLPGSVLRDLSSGYRSVKIAAAQNLHAQGADAILLIEQGSARTGLNYNHGFLLERHGLFLVRTIAGRRDRVKVPLIFSYIDLRTGNLIKRTAYDAGTDADFLDPFKHITEASQVTDADKEALELIYKSKFDFFLLQALLSIRK